VWVTGWQFLGMAVVAVLLTRVTYQGLDRRRSTRLRRLAVGHRVRYSRDDRFGLADRVRPFLLGEDVRHVVVRDLMYATVDGDVVYLFTVVYDAGRPSVPTRRRNVVVATEGRDGGAALRVVSVSLLQDPAGQYAHAIGRLIPPRPGAGNDTE
jgi:hypothetical protein